MSNDMVNDLFEKQSRLNVKLEDHANIAILLDVQKRS